MAYLAKLFNIFHRLLSVEESDGNGVASAARIVRRQGSDVWAAGQTDVGATLSFWLPREPAGKGAP